MPNSAKIIIISKNLELLRKVRFLVSAEGYEVMTATTVKEAEQLCKRFLPDIVVCNTASDLNLLNEVLKLLRKLGGRQIQQTQS